MWASTHIAAGTLVYDATWGEKRWLRWALIVFGGFATHWLLDSTAVYHFFTWHNWWDYAFAAGQVAAFGVLVAWCGPRQLVAGIIAWLSWDIEWVFRYFGWLGQEGFLHRYLLATSSSGQHFTEPVSAALEATLLVALVWLSRPYRWKQGSHM